MRHVATSISRSGGSARLWTDLAFLFVAGLLLAGRAFASAPGDEPRAAMLPLHFEQNEGQTHADVRFLARGGGYALFLTGDQAVFALEGQTRAVFGLRLLGASPAPAVEAREMLPGRVHYLQGSDPQAWRTDVATYARAFYDDVYEGVDLVYYGTDRRELEYDFVVAPGVSPDVIRFAVSGAETVRLDASGDLVLSLGGSEVVLKAPYTYQEVEGVRQTVESRYVLAADGTVGFEVGAYDAARTLVIDPVLRYGTFLGGTGNDQGHGIAVDAAGNAYVTGRTFSNDFPTAGTPYQAAHALNGDAFVSKLSPDGSALIWSTYLGGESEDFGRDIALNASNEVFVVGETRGASFPVASAGALQGTVGNVGGPDGFASKLSADGSTLLWSTFLGGVSNDFANRVAVDAAGDVYVSGHTLSNDFPTAGTPYQAARAGDYDVFVTKIEDATPAFAWSTFLGGTDDDFSGGVAVDALGNVYVAGSTSSADFPTTVGAYDETHNGLTDAFVARLGAAGDVLDYATFYGAGGPDAANDLALDAGGNAYLAGTTDASGLPGVGGFQPAYGGGDTDAFVAKFDDVLASLLYASYHGGSLGETATGIAVDAANRIHFVGYTFSSDLPTEDPLDGSKGDANPTLTDGFVAIVEADASALVFADYIGGNSNERAQGVALGLYGDTYVAGWSSADAAGGFPVTVGAYDETFNGGGVDAFVVRYGFDADIAIDKTVDDDTPDVGATITFTVEAENLGPDDAYGLVVTDVIPAGLDQLVVVAGGATSFDTGTGEWTVGFLASGGTETLTITGRVITDLPFTNTASVSALLAFDANAGNDSDDADVTPYEEADLALSKTANDLSPLVKTSVDYTVTVENLGPTGAADVTVEDVLPAGVFFLGASATHGSFGGSTWDLGFLAAGETATLTLTVEVRVTVPVENCALVTSDHNDADASNDADCVTITARPQTDFWTIANQESGTVLGIGSSPSLPSKAGAAGTIFVGTDGGGVWRSTDGGTNWYPTALQDVHVRAVSVSDLSDAVYAAVYEDGALGGVYRSGDLGDTFPEVFDGVRVLSLAINTFDPINAAGDGDVFIGTESAGVWYSDDDGATWTDISFNLPPQPPQILSLAVKDDAPNDVVFAGTFGKGVYRHEYFSGTWTQVNGGVLDAAVVYALAVSPTTGDLFAGTQDGVYHSTDDGATWTQVLDSPYPDGNLVARALLVYTCDDGGGPVEYLGIGTDGDYFWRAETANPGGTMTQFDVGLQDRTIYALHFVDGYLYAGSMDHGVFRSDDCGETWHQVTDVSLQDAYRAIQALVFDGDNLYAGTYGFGIIMSDDLGDPFLDWSRVNKGLGNLWINALVHKDPNYLFAGTWGGGVYRSTDMGENWMFSGLPHRIVYDMAVSPNGTIFAATDRGEVSRSLDNGLIWQEIGVASTAIWSIFVDPNNANTIYAGTFGAGIYKSTNGGATWAQTSMTSGYAFDFAYGDIPGGPAGAIVVGTADGVKYTTDGGATFFDFSTNLPFKEVRAVAFAGADLLAGTWGGGAYIYDLGSTSWIKDGLPDFAITLFAVSEETQEVYVAAEGEGLYRRNYQPATSTAEEPSGELPTAYGLEQNYPNPFNPVTEIGFALPEASAVRVVVYDVLGRAVRTLVDGRLPAGAHTVRLDASGLPSGTYFYRLETAAQTITKSMILLK